MAGTRRRLAAVLVAVLGAFAGAAGHSITAGGAPVAPAWGTFAHIATNDLESASARAVAAENYSTLILRGALTAGLLSDLRQRRPSIVLLAYEKAAGLSAKDVRTITARNPEWIARDAQGADIHPRGIPDTTLGDLTNPAFRAWQAAQMADEVALGADGAFIDTLGAYFPADFYTSRPVIDGKPARDRAWRDASADLLRRVKAATGKSVIANGFGLGTGGAYFKAPADADVLIAAADGVQIEAFTRWGDAPLTQIRKAPQWDQDLAFLELLGAKGKQALAYTKVKPNAGPGALTSLRDYALASFLLGFAPGKSSFGFDDGKKIPTVQSDMPWARALGDPLGLKARAGGKGWTRQFEGGQLILNVASKFTVIQ